MILSKEQQEAPRGWIIGHGGKSYSLQVPSDIWENPRAYCNSSEGIVHRKKLFDIITKSI